MTRPAWMDSHLDQPQPTAWPANTVARYLTIGGATVDLTYIAHDPERTAARCTGCNEADSFEWNPEEWDYEAKLHRRKGSNPDRATGKARAWAQEHAEKCRAMPRPDGNR